MRSLRSPLMSLTYLAARIYFLGYRLIEPRRRAPCSRAMILRSFFRIDGFARLGLLQSPDVFSDRANSRLKVRNRLREMRSPRSPLMSLTTTWVYISIFMVTGSVNRAAGSPSARHDFAVFLNGFDEFPGLICRMGRSAARPSTASRRRPSRRTARHHLPHRRRRPSWQRLAGRRHRPAAQSARARRLT
jgi:hypothetical protein